MKKLFLIPIMALLVVFGMSFTNEGSEIVEKPDEIVASDYILVNGNWEAIAEQNCEPGSFDCQVQYGQDGPVYKVYDEMNLNTLKDSDTPEPTVINP